MDSSDRPIAAPTAVSATTSGTPAATIAPKAISRMISVIGRLNCSACAVSAPSVSSI